MLVSPVFVTFGFFAVFSADATHAEVGFALVSVAVSLHVGFAAVLAYFDAGVVLG
jgi:hypothetical protein